MPLFEYVCKTCAHRFEALVIGNRSPECPRCKSDQLEKQHSTFGFAGAGRGLASGPYGGPTCSTGGG